MWTEKRGDIMADAILTKAADEKLCALYGEFHAREKSGMPRKSARCFTLGPGEDLDILRELHKVRFIRRPDFDHFALEDAAIVYMGNRPGLLEKALDFGSKVKSAFPFI